MKKSKAAVVRLIAFVVVLGVLLGAGILTKAVSWEQLGTVKVDLASIWKVLLMIFFVLAVESLLVFLLSLPKPQSHRARSVLSIVSSLLKYVAVIVILCWGLSILGVTCPLSWPAWECWR